MYREWIARHVIANVMVFVQRMDSTSCNSELHGVCSVSGTTDHIFAYSNELFCYLWIAVALI